MSDGSAKRLAWSLFTVAVLVVAASDVALMLIDDSTAPRGVSDKEGVIFASIGLLFFALVGAIICSSPRRNVIGWLFMALGIEASFTLPIEAYLRYTLFDSPGALPAAGYVSLLAAVPEAIIFSSAALLLLLFPTGRPASPRWRLLVRVVIGFGITNGLLTLLLPGDTFGYPVENPLALHSGAARGVADGIRAAGEPTFLLIWLLAIGSVIARYLTAGLVERLQLKWFLYAAGLTISGLFVAAFTPSVGDLADIVWTIWFFGLLGLPIAVTFAILRYRLYEIDRIINRTLVYGLLTATLAAIYAGLVVGLQALLSPISSGSNLAIVVTTLVVAALFLPARRRVQDIVDRRFNRRAYDAARTIDAFSSRLRQQIDLANLSGELLAVVDQTMQPTRSSLWLRQAARNDPGTP